MTAPHFPFPAAFSLVKAALCTTFLAALSLSQSQAAVVTVGAYDENLSDENTGTAGIQNNVVDVSATSDIGLEVALSSFTTAVQAAFLAELGGVINFDNGTITGGFGTSSITATYGSLQAKSLTLTADAAASWGLGSSSNRTGISHPGNNVLGNQLGLTGGGAGSEDFVFNFSLVDQVVMAGATVLSRSGSVDVSVVAQATFSDATFASVTFNSAGNSNGGNDTFAGFEAPAGLFITQLRFDNTNTTGSFRSVDDLGFVAVPEPSSALLLFGGAATLLGFRRRRSAS